MPLYRRGDWSIASVVVNVNNGHVSFTDGTVRAYIAKVRWKFAKTISQ
jgi:hypothetical protein